LPNWNATTATPGVKVARSHITGKNEQPLLPFYLPSMGRHSLIGVVGGRSLLIRNDGSVAGFERRGGGTNFRQMLEKSKCRR